MTDDLQAGRIERALRLDSFTVHARYRYRRLALSDRAALPDLLDRLPVEQLQDVRSIANLVNDMMLPALVDQALARRLDGHVPVGGRR